ncbi:MAG TPA: FUSC family protein [Acetobacteraceae bacterium]|jgi:uncharacterized membrane protein YgaE (UPF0421/DUF939 family)|nr:FUSC family protein [Acetobacteraceae bacterium]
MSGLVAVAAPVRRAIQQVAIALRQDLAEMHLVAGRGPQCSMTALAVTLATTVALAARVDAVWWAAISAFVSTRATAPASLQRGGLRIAGTAAGAVLALLLSPWLVEDHVALTMVLLVASACGVAGFLVSPHGYAWLLGAVTTDMVLLAALGDPLSVLTVACNRTAEVTIGTFAAILVVVVLAPDTAPVQPSVAPGWSSLLGVQWPTLQYALQAGTAVMLVPWIWNWLELPVVSQTAITVAAVMAVPALSNDAAADRQTVMRRGIHRILGCLLGGIAGLACLALPVQSFGLWLLMLTAGVWVAAHLQASARGIGYVGTQAAVVFITTLVQDWGPPSSIFPGIERLAGIAGGLVILFVITVVTAPSTRKLG